LIISPDFKKYFLGMSDGTVLIIDSEKFEEYEQALNSGSSSVADMVYFEGCLYVSYE
jgi:hypothetical protein